MDIRKTTVYVCDRCGKRDEFNREDPSPDSLALDELALIDFFSEWGEVLGKDLCPECKAIYLEMFGRHKTEFERFLEEGGFHET